MKAVVERLTQSAFYSSARALFERDRPLFSLLCALEVTCFATYNRLHLVVKGARDCCGTPSCFECVYLRDHVTGIINLRAPLLF